MLPRKSIAAHTNTGFPQRIGLGYDAMGDEPCFSAVQQNIAYGDFLHFSSLDYQRIARPNRRQHATARNFQAYGAKRPQNFVDQLALSNVRGADPVLIVKVHDFWIILHAPWVVSILPHDRALVSNTISKRKDGLW
jgi:hypothetical protein